jgi:transcription initiation factor TFIIB
MSSLRKCSVCGKSKLVLDEQKGEIYCTNCGTVAEDKIFDTGNEAYGKSESGDKKGRGGAPLSWQKADRGIKTTVGKISDIYKLENKGKWKKLRDWGERDLSSIERNLKEAMPELMRIGGFLELPNVVKDEASRIYRFALERSFIRGRRIDYVIAACIYAACRNYDIPRTLDEIADASDLERKEIGRTYRFIIRKLAIKVSHSSPKDYVSRFACTLKLSPKTQNDALRILKKADISELTSGRGPAGIAAAALYVAALLNDEKKTQREVADVAGITEVTIRNRYKELIERLGLEDKLKIKEAETGDGKK